jgi:hypothetical protein
VTRDRRRLVLACALWCAAGLAALPATARAAVSISDAELNPSTTQAAGHPNLTIVTAFSYDSSSDDVKSIRVVLPQGLLGDPTAASRCDQMSFAGDACPADSRVGTTQVTAAVLGVPTNASGDVYSLQPTGAEPARLGVVVRPPVGDKIFLQAPATLGADTNYGLATTFDNLPRSSGGADTQIQRMSLTLNSSAAHGPFTTNPTRCAPATMQVSATSYDSPGQTATGSGSFTPTGCNLVAFSPALSGSVGARGQTGTGSNPPLQTVVTMPGGGANLASVTVSLPADLAPDINGVQRACPPDQFAAGTCPPTSYIGTALAASPLAPAPLTGPVILGSGSFPPPLAVPLTGAVALTLHGVTALPTSPGQGISNTFEGLPDLPVTRFALMLAGGPGALLRATNDLCRPNARTSVNASFTAQTGRTVTEQLRLPVVGCPGGARPGGGVTVRFVHGIGSLTGRFASAPRGPALRRVRLTLPASLTPGARASATRLPPAVYAGGRRLRPSAVRVRGRVVEAVLPGRGARSVLVRWPGLRPSRALARRLASRPPLLFVVRLTDAGRRASTLRLSVRPIVRR